ncbi:uncharacterized protein LOC134537758 isoform X2 [Bacillus rossius redtenbacheri]|uniref:uncharacterized protein LOC134537758 isoform X2 n=1 Tax=Bacillus rossius redtenbacheri TaxID=93214 RepID=UPI002FDECDE6
MSGGSISHTEHKCFSFQILGVLRAPVTAELSVLFMQKIVSISMSNIAYVRRLCNDDSFNEREIHGVNIKILRDDICENGYKIVTWLKGAFDALHKQYLRMLIFAVHTGSLNSPVLETYSYEFTYFNDQELQCVVRSTGSASEGTSSKYTVKRDIYNPEEIEKMTRRLFESCQDIRKILKPLPEEKLLSMKLLYYDNVTPKDYEPPGFVAANSSTFKYACERTPKKIRLGYVATEFHATKVRLQSTLVTDGKDTMIEEGGQSPDEIVSEVSEDVIPATPEHRRLSVVSPAQAESAVFATTASFLRVSSHIVSAQTVTEPESRTAGVSSPQPDSHQFAVPQPLTKRNGTSISSDDESRRSIVLGDGNVPAVAKKQKLPTSEKGNDDGEPPIKKKAVKISTKKNGKKNGKGRPGRKVKEDKENVNSSTTTATDGRNGIPARMKDVANVPVPVDMTSPTVTGKERRDSEKREEAPCDMGSDVQDKAVVHPLSLTKQKTNQAKPAKSSVGNICVNILDVSTSSSMVTVEKEVICCCNSSLEFDLMIRCEVCMTWQHSVCYGILDSNSSNFIEHHCCVQCAVADDPSRQCTDQALFRQKEETRKVLCVFRRALQLCHRLPTVTRAVLQEELELADDVAARLVAELKDKDIIRGSGPRSLSTNQVYATGDNIKYTNELD